MANTSYGRRNGDEIEIETLPEYAEIEEVNAVAVLPGQKQHVAEYELPDIRHVNIGPIPGIN